MIKKAMEIISQVLGIAKNLTKKETLNHPLGESKAQKALDKKKKEKQGE